MKSITKARHAAKAFNALQPDIWETYLRERSGAAARMSDDMARKLTDRDLTVENSYMAEHHEIDMPESIVMGLSTTTLDCHESSVVAELHIDIKGAKNALCVTNADGATKINIGPHATITLQVRGATQNQDLIIGLVDLGRRLEPLLDARRRRFRW
ncbi:hypothetical protein G5V57_24380 [Nordella sp. HKS 07]|uniref:hypothetical protein n=1 Tax=Nordella sp. HKS 07 TaxID=2712222 RepID=UPI0013E205FD|nr:hypothetical protein [Nordella sp. HKS 07]QIG50590.1 hypothetical protein G5V57_24380 [Nordella sp. HKS 07]